MKNKRIIAVAMATGMAVSLAACGGSASTTDTTGTADAATTEAADAATGEGTGFTVQLGPNPETLDPALNAAVDGGNTLITIEEPCSSSTRTTKSSPVRPRATKSAMTAWSGPSICATA